MAEDSASQTDGLNHIPAPSEHAPKKAMRFGDDRVEVHEQQDPADAYILCEKDATVPVEQ
jgi:hypothetical protein